MFSRTKFCLKPPILKKKTVFSGYFHTMHLFIMQKSPKYSPYFPLFLKILYRKHMKKPNICHKKHVFGTNSQKTIFSKKFTKCTFLIRKRFSRIVPKQACRLLLDSLSSCKLNIVTLSSLVLLYSIW